MSYITCIVASCNTRRKPNTDKSFAVKCFSFPKDPVLKKEWLDLCKVSEFDQAKDCNRKVCIKHFKEDDFVDGLKARLLNLQPMRLKKNAVPSLFLGYESHTSASTNTTQILKQEEMLERLTDEDTNKKTKVMKPHHNVGGSLEYLSKLVPIAPKGPIVTHSRKDDGPIITARGPTERRQYSKFLEHHIDSGHKITKDAVSNRHLKILQHDNTIYKKRISVLLDSQQKLITRMKGLEEEIKKEKKDFVIKVKEAFTHVLTPNQVDIILGKKLQVWWTDVEYLKAYTLLELNKQAYCYVKDTLNYPLPGLRALQIWETKMGSKMQDAQDEIKQPQFKRMKLIFEENEHDENKENAGTQHVSELNDLSTHDVNIPNDNEFANVCDIKLESDDICVHEKQSYGEYEIESEINKIDDLNEVHGQINYIDDDTGDNVEIDDSKCGNDADGFKKYGDHVNNDFKKDNDHVNDDALKQDTDNENDEMDDFYEELVIKNLNDNIAIDYLNPGKSFEEDNG